MKKFPNKNFPIDLIETIRSLTKFNINNSNNYPKVDLYLGRKRISYSC